MPHPSLWSGGAETNIDTGTNTDTIRDNPSSLIVARGGGEGGGEDEDEYEYE